MPDVAAVELDDMRLIDDGDAVADPTQTIPILGPNAAGHAG
jgi:hypothetical protein